MRSYFQYITSILVNVQCIKWKCTRITCGVNSTIYDSKPIHKKNKKGGGGVGVFYGWVHACMGVCVWRGVCGVTWCVSGGGWMEEG